MQGERTYMQQRRRRRRSEWIIIVAVALLAHLAVFIFLKPSYLEIFRSEPPGDEGSSSFTYINGAFSLVPDPELTTPAEHIERPAVSEDVVEETSVLDQIGEPSVDIEPVQGGAGGGSDGRKGPRRTTVEPKPLFMPWPRYPEGVDKGIDGEVELLLFVDEKGIVREIRISRGLSDERLNSTAVKAARNIRFIPGEVHGEPTAMWIRLTIGFQPR